MFEITVKKTFTDNDIDDILVTALEGGINYWAVSALPKNKDYKGADYASHCVSKGGTLIIKTDEGDKHELDSEKLKKGIELYIEKEGAELNFLENMDAVVADHIIQYSIFGELVYA